jgi:ribosomal protein S18 acetylase RimI-like enzyme
MNDRPSARDNQLDTSRLAASDHAVTVEKVTEVTDELVEAIARLVPQLSSSAAAPDARAVAALAASPCSTLFVCRKNSGERPVVGMLTLVTYQIPTGLRAVVEDVVVDESARGTGAGAALVAAGLVAARDAGAREVDLTSRPSREAANRLYARMGFDLRETNVYRHRLR